MGDKRLIVIIKRGGSCPMGGRIEISGDKVKEGRRIYFPREFYVSGLLFPADTVLVFDEPLQKDQAEVTALAVTGTYSLIFGFHKGTKETKNSSQIVGFESLDALRRAFEEIKKDFLANGYQVWFANAYAPGASKNPIALDEHISLNEPTKPD